MSLAALVSVCAGMLSACAGPAVSPAVGVPGTSSGGYKIGKPYQVRGIWYKPSEDFYYDETGIASWYGPGFHKERTANGERFDQEQITAAHKTLQLPTLARVTNLDNGRSIVVRINDRGPFVAGRIIDMSHRSAQLLGFDRVGTAKVRVRVLTEESRALAAAAKANRPYTPPLNDAGPMLASGGPGSGAGAAKSARSAPVPLVSHERVGSRRQIYVQAGAFTQYNNASHLMERIAGIAPSSISETRVGGVSYYRVRLGPIATVDQADGILNRTLDAGGSDARVVVD